MAHTFELSRRKHLEQYRISTLGISECGTFTHRGVERPYGHILPAERFEENILPTIRSSFWQYFRTRTIQLHRYFHHLNSSQALCFNLFFPLMSSEDGLREILRLIGLAEADPSSSQFEFVPDPSEGTSVDFTVLLSTGARILFEIKYTEADFGSAANDPAHREKFEQIYVPRVDARFQAAYTSRESFLRHYQIMRNILHLRLDRMDQLVFLVPRLNRSLSKRLPAIYACLNDAARKHVHILYLEEVITTLETATVGTKMAQSIKEFREKYL